MNVHKRRKFDTTKLYKFHRFCEADYPPDFTGLFSENIKRFAEKCGEKDADIEGCSTWFTLLVKNDNGSYKEVLLYTIEESVEASKLPSCDHCLFTGWSHHFVSRRRYHFIIPVVDRFPDIRLSDPTHLLHGLIHCNGYGHLLSINGVEGGSKFFSGKEIMDLWDRICTALRVRKISVEDVSKRGLMDLRLLYGVVDGQPWFGKWGYKFCHGSSNVIKEHYDTAMDMLSLLNLDHIVEDSSGNEYMKKIIKTYRELSDTQLITIKDLLRFMLFACKALSKPISIIKPIIESAQERLSLQDVTNKHVRSNKSKSQCKSTKSTCSPSKSLSIAAQMPNSRWTAEKLTDAAEAIVSVLKEKDAECLVKN
ncbi:hypothetical protein MKW92_024363 [Papaver armeniacum]|nr:hypothetical protein MKW92_024363 [Papaver armeniacum]